MEQCLLPLNTKEPPKIRGDWERFKSKTPEEDYALNLYLAGNICTGKTSLILRYVEDIFSENTPTTLAPNSIKIKTINYQGKNVKVRLYDTDGSERFRSNLSSNPYKHKHGLLFVYDVSDQESFSSLTEWLSEATRSSDHFIPWCVVANKMDIIGNDPEKDSGSSSVTAVKSLLEEFHKSNPELKLLDALQTRNTYFAQTSALTGKGVEDCLFLFAKKIIDELVVTMEKAEKVEKGPSTPEQTKKHKDCIIQ